MNEFVEAVEEVEAIDFAAGLYEPEFVDVCVGFTTAHVVQTAPFPPARFLSVNDIADSPVHEVRYDGPRRPVVEKELRWKRFDG